MNSINSTIFKCIAKYNDLQSLSDAMRVECLVTLRSYAGERVNMLVPFKDPVVSTDKLPNMVAWYRFETS